MIADVVGFSSLMERDEAQIYIRLHDLLEQIISPGVAQGGGRIIKTLGDGFIADFPSATAAVKCAIEVQRRIIDCEAGREERDRIRFRMGINIGDVIIDGDDIAGDGVNVAARLEPLAPPDGICVSGAVREQVRQDLGVAYIDLGDKQVKNLARPIRAFAIDPSAPPTAAAEANAPKPPWRGLSGRRILFAVGGLVAVLGLVIILAPWSWPPRHPTERFSVAVLPFTNASGDPNLEYLADAVTDGATAELCLAKGAFVISRSTAFTYKRRPIDTRTVGNELGVRYVLQGSIAAGADSIRVNAQLVDTGTMATTWADTLEVSRSAETTLPSVLVAHLASALKLELSSSTRHAVSATDAGASEVNELVMQAWARFNQGPTRENVLAAQAGFEKALNVRKDFEPALTGRSRMLLQQALTWPGPDRMTQLAEAERDAAAALRTDPADAVAHYVVARVAHLKGHVDVALAEIDAALKLNPNFADAYAFRGIALVASGYEDKAPQQLQQALALSPRDPARSTWMFWICSSYTKAGKFKDAVPWCERSIALAPEYASLTTLIAAYTALGERDRAQAAAAQLARVKPEFGTRF